MATLHLGPPGIGFTINKPANALSTGARPPSGFVWVTYGGQPVIYNSVRVYARPA